jgi:hypothetical protein
MENTSFHGSTRQYFALRRNLFLVLLTARERESRQHP